MMTTSSPVNSSGFGGQANGVKPSSLGQNAQKSKEVDKVELPLGAYEFSQQLFRQQPVDDVVILEPTTVESGPLASAKSQEQNLIQAADASGTLPLASYRESHPPVAKPPGQFPETTAIDLESSPNTAAKLVPGASVSIDKPPKDVTPITSSDTADHLQLSAQALSQDVQTQRNQAGAEIAKTTQYLESEKQTRVNQEALRQLDQSQPVESSSAGLPEFNRLF